jgi:hypothetical protein
LISFGLLGTSEGIGRDVVRGGDARDCVNA